jgi:hypothetical protein
MTNSIRLAKNALVLAVAAATILATAGLTAFVPAQASAAEFGDLIMGETLSTVYYYGSDGQRYSFPNEKTYFSWYSDFDGVVSITDEELADITLAGNIVARPGSRWVKIESDEKVYAVSTDGSIHWIEDEATAVGLAGDDWNTFIDDVPDVFFVDYTVGDSLTDASEGYNGMLWTDGSDNYLVWAGELRAVSDLDDNMYQSGFVLSGEGFDMDAVDAGDDIDGELALLTDAAQMVETEEYAETEDISVSLSSESPSASTLIAAQGVAHIASYEFANPSSSDVDVTSVTLSRTGVSSDTTFSNVYLFDGWSRLSDSATVSSGSVNWGDTGGLFTIPAGDSVTVDVRSDILTGTSGQTIGVSLDPDDLEFDGSFAASGSSIASAEHTIAAVTSGTFGSVSFASTTTPSSDGAPNPENDFRAWENVVTVGNNESYLYNMRLRNVGSVNADDIENWRLYIDGVAYGDAVDMQDADGYINFDLSDDPIRLSAATHTFKVLVDIVGGSTRTLSTSLRYAADAIFLDEDYNQGILVQANSSSFSARSASAQTIATGALTFTKQAASPSGDVINVASNASLATFDVKATGEAMKIEQLNFNVETTVAAGNTAVRLRNGAIYVDGTQVGSTSVICGNDTTTASACTGVAGSGASYSSYTFGSSFIVYPGSPVVMDVRADIYDSDGTNAPYAAADTIRLDIDATNLPSGGNVLRMTSGGYGTYPAADTLGNSLTVREGSLTLAKNTSYANQTVVVPKNAYKVGSWTVNATTTEDINLTSIDVNFDADNDADAALATADYTNLYIMYGPSGDLTESSTKAAVTTGNSWSVNYTIEAGETIYIDAYADVASGASDSADASDYIIANVDLAGTAPASGTSVTATDVDAQTISYNNAGTFTTAVAGDTPVAKAYAADQEIDGAKFKITSENEDYTISEIQVKVGSVGAAGVIGTANIYDGEDLLGSGVFNQSSNTAALVTGLSLEVPSNTSTTLTVKLDLNEVGTGAGLSGNNLAVTLDSVKYSDSQGVEATEGTDRAGNEIRVYKSLPTVAHVDLTNSTIVNGQAIDLYKFTITADSNGPVSIKQLRLPITWTDVDADTLEVEKLKLYKNGTDISTSSTAVELEDDAGESAEDGSTDSDDLDESSSDLYIIWDTTEEVIAAGETVTYTVRGTPEGFDSDGTTGEEDYFTIYLQGDSAALSSTINVENVCLDDTGSGNIWQLGDTASVGTDCTATDTGSTAANFIWSDANLAGHDGTETTAPDWAPGYLVLSLDLDGETWYK